MQSTYCNISKSFLNETIQIPERQPATPHLLLSDLKGCTPLTLSFHGAKQNLKGILKIVFPLL